MSQHSRWSHVAPLTVVAVSFAAMLMGLALGAVQSGLAAEQTTATVHDTIRRTNQLWDRGTPGSALELLDQALRSDPRSTPALKLRGDIQSAIRRQADAVESYRRALDSDITPTGIRETRWALWSLLLRTGKADEAASLLKTIATADPHNPITHLRLAQDLRKIDRLEDSLDAYARATEAAPSLLSWRLGLARARFDLLDYQGAERDIQYVLDQAAPDSLLLVPAHNLMTALYSSQERGRRFERSPATDATPERLREWAEVRGDAWQHYSTGRFAEAEPLLRKTLALNPKDPTATYQLGVTLMQLDRCDDALPLLRRVTAHDGQEEAAADALFRQGQCLMRLERFEESYVQFHQLYVAAVEFEVATRGTTLPPDARVLDKAKIQRWLDQVRPHVEAFAAGIDTEMQETTPTRAAAAAPTLTEEEALRRAMDRLKPQEVVDARAPLLGRDTDFSWFRFVIPSAKVVRDDSPTGAHEYIPINPEDTFPSTQGPIYLVFALVTTPMEEIPLTARCFVELPEAGDVLVQDRVAVSMNDQTGYFHLTPTKDGSAAQWRPGLYRCGLYAGERISAYNHVDEVRFRIAAMP
ncbi:MAG: tetratricopeptide repeat protein [Nitrospiraceae bacterium]